MLKPNSRNQTKSASAVPPSPDTAKVSSLVILIPRRFLSKVLPAVVTLLPPHYTIVISPTLHVMQPRDRSQSGAPKRKEESAGND